MVIFVYLDGVVRWQPCSPSTSIKWQATSISYCTRVYKDDTYIYCKFQNSIKGIALKIENFLENLLNRVGFKFKENKICVAYRAINDEGIHLHWAWKCSNGKCNREDKLYKDIEGKFIELPDKEG